MSMTKQEKLGTVNFILTVLAIILIKYLSMFVPWIPTGADGTIDMMSLALVTIVAVLVVHVICWALLTIYFDIKSDKSVRNKLIIYEILFAATLFVLYGGLAYPGMFPEFIENNLLTGIGLFLIAQMLISIFYTYSISKIPQKTLGSLA
ncbi:MAG: hypothetical protein FWE78_04825 [Methanimicrococcus sp.]|nr:hypothetical protein [Methanimicrococcus sp.]